MPVLPAASGDKGTSSVRYVALGDSIAHGYGLSNPDEESYAGQVASYLQQHYDYVFSANLGQDGLRSEELLAWLTDPENENYKKCIATLKNADIVTISIGSNDLLHLIELGPEMMEKVQSEQSEFQKACDDFAVTFPRIIRAIKATAPEAKIFVGNVYNPCHGFSYFEEVEGVAEEYIIRLNQAFQKSSDYELIDIKTAFGESEKKLINMGINWERIDPHPNEEGHFLIGKLIIDRMKEKGFY